MTARRIPDPLVCYLATCPQAGSFFGPECWDELPSPSGLLATRLQSEQGKRQAGPAWWLAFLRASPDIEEWTRGSQAFKAPVQWGPPFEGAPYLLPANVTPLAWAQAIFPPLTREAWVATVSPKSWTALGALSAYAIGWPYCEGPDGKEALRAVKELMTIPPFVAWAWRPIPSAVIPRESSGRRWRPLYLRNARRDALLADPLVATEAAWRHGMAKQYHSARGVLDVPGSSRPVRSARRPLLLGTGEGASDG